MVATGAAAAEVLFESADIVTAKGTNSEKVSRELICYVRQRN
jgi:hypothetical protein